MDRKKVEKLLTEIRRQPVQLYHQSFVIQMEDLCTALLDAWDRIDELEAKEKLRQSTHEALNQPSALRQILPMEPLEDWKCEVCGSNQYGIDIKNRIYCGQCGRGKETT